MRLCVIQMDMRLGESAYNFAHAEALLRRAAAAGTASVTERSDPSFKKETYDKIYALTKVTKL